MCLLRRPVRLRVGVFFGASSNGGERHGCVRRPPGAPDRDVYDLEHDGGVRRVRRLSAGARGSVVEGYLAAGERCDVRRRALAGEGLRAT